MVKLRVELLHADPTGRVVRVTALEGERQLGSCLGEAATAEQAEDRAVARLLERLGQAASKAAPLPPAEGAGPPAVVAGPPAAGASRVPAGAAVERVDTPPDGTTKATNTDTSNGSARRRATAGDPARQGGAGPGGERRQDRAAMASGPATAPAAAPSGANGSASPSATEPGPEAAPQEPPPDPDDWSQELAGLELQLRRLGWGREQEEVFLERAFGHPSRSRLTTYADLMTYLRALEALAAGADPASAAVPLRRRDLLRLGDELLNSLGWSAERGRHFLEEQLGQTSRQRLSDAELMRFNMLLEEELIQLDPASRSGPGA